MNFFWPRRGHLTYSNEYAVVTYDRPVYYKGSSIRLPDDGPSSCVWIVPGTHS